MSLFKVLKLNQISPNGLDRLPSDQFEIASEFSTPDAILLRSHKLQPDEIAASVMGIARAGAGTNNIPLAECSKRGIVVFNTPGANANAVKELVLAGLILGSRGIVEGNRWVAGLGNITDDGELNKTLEAGKKNFKGNELSGKTLGVVGLGAIGSMVASTGLDMGMRVVGYDPALSVEAAWKLPRRVERMENLQSLFARADYVSLHLPVLDATRNLINADLLNVAKPGLCLLNFARAEIVDVDAVVEALNSKKIAKYVADFPTNALIGRDDVLLMPHIGASTDEAEDNCAVMAANQLSDFLINGNIRNSVNYPTLWLERSTDYRIAIMNDNVPRILGNLLSILADENINVVDMLNKSRDQVAYTLIDIDAKPDSAVIEKMRACQGVVGVRVIG